jgi:hypothetical protein
LSSMPRPRISQITCGRMIHRGLPGKSAGNKRPSLLAAIELVLWVDDVFHHH